MDKRGGKREGAGRPKGKRSKRTLDAMAAGMDGLSPLDYMLGILRDESKPEMFRMDAAKAAAPYVHSRLSNVEMSVSDADKPAEELPEDILNRIAATGSAGVIEAEGSSPQSEGIH